MSEPAVDGFHGTALDDSVRVVVDEGGSVLAVHLDPVMVGRLWPDQIARAVVSAHAEARAAAAEYAQSEQSETPTRYPAVR